MKKQRITDDIQRARFQVGAKSYLEWLILIARSNGQKVVREQHDLHGVDEYGRRVTAKVELHLC